MSAPPLTYLDGIDDLVEEEGRVGDVTGYPV